ncbi:hypothetical protein ACFQRK_23465 [Parapedobacter sp. GCM10030251]|uniref:hypothetical protein n=1 Tax=Parapedobacter sp. GCM10030251 TaxID=3273419 RepID=UPI003617570B
MKQVNINAEIRKTDFGDQLQFKLLLNQNVGTELCMALMLLKEGLVDVIGLKFLNYSFTLKISRNNYSYSESEIFGSEVLKGKISVGNIDYILHYVLKFYRDGYAEAEHIDIDFLNDGGKGYTFTISCVDYPEYSSEEIKRMLD